MDCLPANGRPRESAAVARAQPRSNLFFEPPVFILAAWLALVALALFVIPLTAPPNLLQGNENRVGAYVSDIIQNGNWLCQRDATGEITSKPPMFAWVSAIAALAVGEIDQFTLYFPSALATLLLSAVLFAAGRKYFDWRTGFLAGLVYLLSHVGETQFATARFDGFFALPVTIAALAAFRAWGLGRGWIWFWLAAAVATLVKGPLGLVLAAAGLLASLWERRSQSPAAIRGSHLTGIVLYLLITGGWFVLAYFQEGKPLVDKMLVRELFTHAVGKQKEAFSISKLFHPFGDFLADFGPWSLFACLAFWNIWKRPSTDLQHRRLERFLFCWFFVGLIMFSLAPHQRGRLILPIIPAAAFLAGREISRRISSWPTRKMLNTSLLATVLILGVIAVRQYIIAPRTSDVRTTLELRKLARRVNDQGGLPFPFTHVNSHFAFQIYLKTFRPDVSLSDAERLLKGSAPAFVVIKDPEKLREKFATNGPVLYELARCQFSDEPFLSILSNHPRLEWTRRAACILRQMEVETDGARLISERENQFVFIGKGRGKIKLTNLSAQSRLASVRLLSGNSDKTNSRQLATGETWEIEFQENFH